jgi:hypothetical protein
MFASSCSEPLDAARFVEELELSHFASLFLRDVHSAPTSCVEPQLLVSGRTPVIVCPDALLWLGGFVVELGVAHFECGDSAPPFWNRVEAGRMYFA